MSSELATQYLGIRLESPVIVGSCPLTIEPEAARQMVDCGAGAIVLPSILQEQIENRKSANRDPHAAPDRSAEPSQHDKYNGGPENYLLSIAEIKKHISVPVIANMNGAADGNWLEFAQRIEASGADAIELMIQPAMADPLRTSDQIEAELCSIVASVCKLVTIPVAVKLAQRFTNLALVAHQLQSAGAAGVVLFAHLPQWDVCIDRLHWTLRWALTPIDSIGATLDGIARARVGGLDLSIAASGGIRTSEDAIKSIIAGADAVMVTSEIYRAGPDVIRSIVDGVTHYVECSEFESLQQLCQSRPILDFGSEQFSRIEYLDSLKDFQLPSPPSTVPKEATGDRYGHRL